MPLLYVDDISLMILPLRISFYYFAASLAFVLQFARRLLPARFGHSAFSRRRSSSVTSTSANSRLIAVSSIHSASRYWRRLVMSHTFTPRYISIHIAIIYEHFDARGRFLIAHVSKCARRISDASMDLRWSVTHERTYARLKQDIDFTAAEADGASSTHFRRHWWLPILLMSDYPAAQQRTAWLPPLADIQNLLQLLMRSLHTSLFLPFLLISLPPEMAFYSISRIDRLFLFYFDFAHDNMRPHIRYYNSK